MSQLTNPNMNPSRILAESIFKELNLGEMSPEEKEKALMLIENRFEEVVIETVLGGLSDEELAKFKEAASGENGEDAVAEFIARRPELSQRIGERMLAEREIIIAALA